MLIRILTFRKSKELPANCFSMFPSCFIPLVLLLYSYWLTVHVWPSVLLLCLSCLCPQIYKEQLNTRVVLVAVETWTDRDRINIHPDPLQMLHDFSKYRQHYIKQHADAVHLLSYVPFYNGLDYHSSVYISIYCRCLPVSSCLFFCLIINICLT